MIIAQPLFCSPGRPDQRSATAWCSAVGGSRSFFPRDFLKGDLRKNAQRHRSFAFNEVFFEFSTILLGEITIQSDLCNSQNWLEVLRYPGLQHLTTLEVHSTNFGVKIAKRLVAKRPGNHMESQLLNERKKFQNHLPKTMKLGRWERFFCC